jgi:hypothetical protein
MSENSRTGMAAAFCRHKAELEWRADLTFTYDTQNFFASKSNEKGEKHGEKEKQCKEISQHSAYLSYDLHAAIQCPGI